MLNIDVIAEYRSMLIAMQCNADIFAYFMLGQMSVSIPIFQFCFICQTD